MNIITVAPTIPSPQTGGGGNWGACFIRSCIAQGHTITHIAVIGKHPTIIADPKDIETYKTMGVNVLVVPYQNNPCAPKKLWEKIISLISPNIADIWPHEIATADQVAKLIRQLQPHCVVPFTIDAVIYTDQVSDIPRVGILTEGPHINTKLVWKYDPIVPRQSLLQYFLYTFKTFALSSMQEKGYAQLCKRLTIAAFQGPHYVRWAKNKGVKQACFITTPTFDSVGASWKQHRENSSKEHRPYKILMIGHLHSTSNRSGLALFFYNILPELEKKLGHNAFEVHIVGKNDAMPKRFDPWRNHSMLKFRGTVYPADQEFISSDVLLVPIPAKTGSRVRIINGFSFGCCVVAHTANALGIPELKHNDNCLLASTGKQIATETVRALQSAELRKRLGENGRKTYEQYYTEEVGGKQLVQLIEKALGNQNS